MPSLAQSIVIITLIVIAPEVEWKIPDVIIPEGENREVCFTTNIGTAVPYQVEVGTRIKGDNPATGNYVH